MELKHIPVLLDKCIEGLNIKKNGIYVDGTLGGAGHSYEIAKKLNNTGKLIGIDRDEKALNIAKEKLSQFNNIIFVHDNHDNLKKIMQDLNIAEVDGILLDLGVSSFQIDEGERGFSYIKESTLDMRMDRSQALTAKEVVNTYDEAKLANIIYEYGEEKFSKRIDGHPAKRTFQAIRIEVNNEIEPLKSTVSDAISLLKPGGRLCIITFHSLEDRAVKNAYIELAGKCTCPPDLPYCICGAESKGKIITRKPIIPTEEEKETNSRSQSAKLRIFERI